MRIFKKRLKNEKGSATLEFLGMMPFVLLMMLMLWQVVAGAYVLIAARSAVNEAAKVYSTTGSVIEARQASDKIIDPLNHVTTHQTYITPLDGRRFEATVQLQLSLAFLPDQFLGMTIPTVPITQTIESRRI